MAGLRRYRGGASMKYTPTIEEREKLAAIRETYTEKEREIFDKVKEELKQYPESED